MHPDAPPTGPVARPAGAAARAVYADLLRFGPRPRTALAARLDLSGPTLTRVSRELLDAGLLRELPPRPQLKGRPQEPLDIDEEHARFLGVKITADEVHAAVSTVRGTVLEDLAQPHAGRSPAAVVDAVCDLALPLLRAHPRVAGAGVSLPGTVVDDAVRASPLLGWDAPVALGAALHDRLGVPISVANDVAALLEGIAWSGAGRRADPFAVLTVGAGVAVGVVQGGRVLRGARHLAGLTEALPVADGRTLGEAARTAAVLARARSRGAIGPADSLPVLLAAASRRESAAVAVADEVARAAASAAAAVVALADPAMLVVGGESVPLLDLGTTPFAELLRRRLPAAQRDLEIRTLAADFDAWSRGAAVLAIRAFVGLG